MSLYTTLRQCAISRTSTVLECKRLSLIPCNAYNTNTDNYRIIENTNLNSVQRGSGYRSSFNGTVCTVIGSTGYIGSALVNRLGRNGTQIIAAYRGSHYDAMPLKTATDLGQLLFTQYHIRDEESLRKAVKYSDVVVNLVGQDCDSWNFKLEEVHIDGARRIAKACRQMGVKKLIHLSSMGVSPNPKTIIVPGGSRFLKSKWYGEQAVREEFPDAIIVRPADVFGETDRFLDYYGTKQRLVDGKLYLHERGDNVIKQPVYIDDVVEGLFELVNRPRREVNGKTYQFVGPDRYYLGELCDYLYKLLWRDQDRYERLDSRLSWEFNLMLRMRNTLYLVKPGSGISIERFEREHATDTLDKDLPTLADLGVPLDRISRYAYSLLRVWRFYQDYTDEVYEFDEPNPPAPAER